MTKETLAKRYKDLCKEYSHFFTEITEKHGEWSTDYDIFITEFEAYSFDEIRYIVDHSKELTQKYKDLSKELYNWVEYNLFCYDYGISYINLKSWLNGAPRMSEEQMRKIKNLKMSMDIKIEELTEEYGKTDDTPEWVKNNIKKQRK